MTIKYISIIYLRMNMLLSKKSNKNFSESPEAEVNVT